MLKQGFYQAVTLGRGTRLKIGPETLLRGQIWTGSQALRLGLVDKLGSETDALQQAASMAHLWNYSVNDLYIPTVVAQTSGYGFSFFLKTKEGVTLPYPSEAGLYMLYIPELPAQK